MIYFLMCFSWPDEVKHHTKKLFYLFYYLFFKNGDLTQGQNIHDIEKGF